MRVGWLIAVLLVPLVTAAADNDDGTGTDASFDNRLVLPLGIHQGGLDPANGDEEDVYTAVGELHRGLSINVTFAERSDAFLVFFPWCNCGSLSSDAGTYAWRGGKEWSFVDFSISKFDHAADYEIVVASYPMADLSIQTLTVERLDEDHWRVQGTIKNEGELASEPTEISITTDHFHQLVAAPLGPVPPLGRLDSQREVARLGLGALAPAETVPFEAIWDSFGEAGSVRLLAIVEIEDAMAANNAAELRVDPDPVPLFLPDGLNTEYSHQLGPYAGTYSPNGEPGVVIGFQCPNVDQERQDPVRAHLTRDPDVKAEPSEIVACATVQNTLFLILDVVGLVVGALP